MGVCNICWHHRLIQSLDSVWCVRFVQLYCGGQDADTETLEKAKKILTSLPPAEQKNVNLEKLVFYKGGGCEICSGLGYKGRIGIYEIFTMNKEIEAIILSGNLSEYAIQEIAVKNGMVTMAQDGLLKALDKITTVEEIFRVSE